MTRTTEERTTTTRTRRVDYEVSADFIELVDPSGHKHWLGAGQPVPKWADPSVVAGLVNRDAIIRYEVI